MGLHLLDADMEHPTREPDSHCWVIWERQEWKDEVKDCGCLKARRKGPRDGSSGREAGMGWRRRGSGVGKVIRVDEGE